MGLLLLKPKHSGVTLPVSEQNVWFSLSSGISAFTQQPSSIVVTEGSVARFSCRISAVPPPIITWEFNRVTLPLATDRYAPPENPDVLCLSQMFMIFILFPAFRITVLPGGVLQIHGVGQRDAGNYRCVAANIASRRRSVEAALTVTPGEPGTPHSNRRPSLFIYCFRSSTNCFSRKIPVQVPLPEFLNGRTSLPGRGT